MFQRFQISRRIPPDIHNRLLLLLLLLTIGCLGAIPLAPHLLAPVISQHTNQVTSNPQKTYTDGKCTADTAHVVYTPAVSSVKAPKSWPKAWKLAGLSGQDQAYFSALACAATFVKTYETFDYRQPKTLYQALPLVSATAQQRFYEGAGKIAANDRTKAAWLNTLKQKQVSQTASVSLPHLSTSFYTHGALYLTLAVPYHTTGQNAGKTTSQQYQATILLKGVQPDPKQKNINWQILDWQENT